jgi:ubiquinone/menaquinone biosynthesis C-methylase UbiE
MWVRSSLFTLSPVLLVISLVSVSRAPAFGQVTAADAPAVHPVSGRHIAQVMSHLGADWLDRPERNAEEQPEKALDDIGVKAGDVVADVGAGTGYYTVKLAHRVQPGGRVYATDIQPEMIAKLRARLAAEKVSGVEPVLARVDDPGLPAHALDLILMVDVYHELSEPERTLQRLKAALKPTGRLVLLEFRKEDPTVPIRIDHKMSIAEARLEVEHEGFVFDRVSEVLPWQHILVFRPAPRP